MAQIPLDVSYYQADTSEPLLELTLGQLLRQVASEVPDRLALVDTSTEVGRRRSWTYRELLAASEQTARALLTHFSVGERVAVCAGNCAEWVLLQHGMHLAGLILVPLNPAYRHKEVEQILEASGAAGIVYQDRYRDNDIGGIVEMLRGKLKDIREAIRLEEWETFFDSADASITLPDIQPGNILQIQYTSGTTGVPKGAVLHHRGAVNTSRFVAMRAGFPEGGIWLNAMPMFHIAGPVVTEIGTIALRGTYVLMPGFDPGRMLELIEQERANATLIVPTMILALLDHPDFANRRLGSLTTILSGATAVPAALVTRAKNAFGCEFSILFGQTELNGVVCQTRTTDSVEDQSETLGKPLPQTEVAILNPDTSQVLPLNQPGEICVRGYQNMLGYYGLPDATRQCITEDGWLHTGDIGTMDSRGYLRIDGRLKDMVIRGGMNLYPREIEDTLFNHPAVAQVSVIGVPDEKWGEVVAAVIVPKGDAGKLSILDLHTFCRERLAAHKTPALWFIVENFPMTPTGKIQKYVLRKMIVSGELKPTEWERPKVAS